MVHEENLSQEVIHFAMTGVLVKIQSWFLQTDMAKLSIFKFGLSFYGKKYHFKQQNHNNSDSKMLSLYCVSHALHISAKNKFCQSQGHSSVLV